MHKRPDGRPGTHTRTSAPGKLVGAAATLALGLGTLASPLLMSPAAADPAPDAPVTTVSSPGAFSVDVPDGVCSVTIELAGGAGGDALGGNTQGAGAVIEIGPFPVSPGDTVDGLVGGVGGNAGEAGTTGGGAGSPNGGHPGAGGGGYTDVSLGGGDRLALAGGGGGSGGGHVPEWGHGGDAGVPNGAGVFPGSDGLDGDDGPNARPGGGAGGGTSFGGAGGVHPDDATVNGESGSALQGGTGGFEPSLDGGAGGGGGLFGGGGGASTTVDGVGGAGGGGGSSFVDSGVSFLSGGLNTAGGYVELTWQMCEYDLAVTKVASSDVYELTVPVTYTVTVENLGPEDMPTGDTVTLRDPLAAGATLQSISSAGGSGQAVVCDPEVGDDLGAGGVLECGRPSSASPGAELRGLDVGETLTVTYTQTVAGPGEHENEVTTTDRGDQDNNTASATLVPAEPALDMVKSASPDEITAAGEVVTYSFDVTNTGNIELFDIAINEGSFSGTGDLDETQCPDVAAGLQPGDDVTCTVDYVATQADVDAGEITNTATAEGTTPGGAVAESDPSAAAVEAIQAPALDLVKSSDHERLPDAGQTVNYLFTLTNSGNVTLTDLSVQESSFSGTGAMSAIACPAAPLAPGDSAACTSSYVVTAADVEAGEVTNTAVGGAVAPDGSSVASGPSTHELDDPWLPFLPATGALAPLWLGGAGALMLLLGCGIVLMRRRTGSAIEA